MFVSLENPAERENTTHTEKERKREYSWSGVPKEETGKGPG